MGIDVEISLCHGDIPGDHHSRFRRNPVSRIVDYQVKEGLCAIITGKSLETGTTECQASGGTDFLPGRIGCHSSMIDIKITLELYS